MKTHRNWIQIYVRTLTTVVGLGSCLTFQSLSVFLVFCSVSGCWCLLSVAEVLVSSTDPPFMTQQSRLWDHSKTPQYTLSPSWRYRMPQNFIQQGSRGFQTAKPFAAQGKTPPPHRQPIITIIIGRTLTRLPLPQAQWSTPTPTSPSSHMSDIKST